MSETTVNNCRALYQGDTTKRFANVAAYSDETADLVLSLDVIYHLVEDETFHDYMTRLVSATDRYLIVYSSNSDEHEDNGKHEHVRHRKFTNWIDEHAPDIKLTKHVPNKYQYNGNNDVSSYADFYMFERQARP